MSENKQDTSYFNDGNEEEMHASKMFRPPIVSDLQPLALADAYPGIDKISGRVLKHRRFILDNEDLL